MLLPEARLEDLEVRALQVASFVFVAFAALRGIGTELGLVAFVLKPPVRDGDWEEM